MPAIAEPPAPITTAPAAKPGEAASSMLEQMMHGERQPKAKPETKPETKPDPEVVKPAAAKPELETKQKPVKAAPVATAPAAEPNYEKIAEASARGVAQALAAPKKEEATNPLADLNDDEKEMHEAFEQMEKDYPAQYKGKLATRYVESLKAADKWEQDWLDSHPGQELDLDSAEYREFSEKNAVKYSDLHLHKSLANMSAEKTLSKVTEKERDREKEAAAQTRRQAETPKIVAHSSAIAREYFTALGEEYKAVLDADGKINREEIKRLLDADPIKGIAMQSATNVEAFTSELYALTNGLSEFSAKNDTHQFIAGFVEQKEAAMKSLTPHEQVNEHGQRFATAAEYNEMTPEARRNYWRYNHKDLAGIYAAEQAQHAKTAIAAEEKRMEDIALKRGFVKAVPNNGAPTTTAQPVKAATPPPVLPPSPSGAIEPRAALPSSQVALPKKSAADSFTAQWLG